MLTLGRVLTAACIAAPLVLATVGLPQVPSRGGVVTVHAVPDSASSGVDPDSAGVDPDSTGVDPGSIVLGLGFVVDSAQVVAHVSVGVDTVVVVDSVGNEFGATVVARDDSTGLVLLTVPDLALPPYRFSHDPPELEEEVVAASRDSTGLKLVSGRILELGPDSLAADRGLIRHDAFADVEFNLGAPLLNGCGEVLGVAIDSVGGVPRRPGALAITAERLLALFGPTGLTASPASEPCLTEAEKAAEAGTAAIEAAARAEAAESAAVAADRRAAEAEASAADARRAAAQAREAQEQAAEAREEAEERATEAEERADAARQEGAAERARYLQWILAVVGVAAAIGLLMWVLSLRSVSKAKQAEAKAATLAQAAREDLDEREAREQVAEQVPSVFLEGTDVDGSRFSLRVPGQAIAARDGVVVGRNPFDSTLVLDHSEVSRRHFRLFLRGSSVLIEDLNSTNGTKVSSVALSAGGSAELREGDVLEVGSLGLVVSFHRR